MSLSHIVQQVNSKAHGVSLTLVRQPVLFFVKNNFLILTRVTEKFMAKLENEKSIESEWFSIQSETSKHKNIRKEKVHVER